jgi:isocitrate dehydrogenase (NAD+)
MPPTLPKAHKAVLIAGDGIGPEIASAVRKIFEEAQAPIEWIERDAGITALNKGLALLPEDTLEAIIYHKVALKGPCTTPVGEGFTSINVGLRKKLGLYAAVRPVRSLAGIKTRYENIDTIIVRENTEGLYAGVESEVVPGVVTSLKVATEAACTRIARWAFRFATLRKRKKITLFHKANIMKLTDGMMLRCVQKIYEDEYPNIEYQSLIIDAGCMKLVQDPTQFDILLMENLYGDVVSDLAAGLVGGLGVTPGANIGDDQAVFEAVHGSAPDIAGKGLANPLALLLSGVMMLNHLGDSKHDDRCKKTAKAIREAAELALADGQKTRDLGGDLSTNQFTDAVIDRLKAGAGA